MNPTAKCRLLTAGVTASVLQVDTAGISGCSHLELYSYGTRAIVSRCCQPESLQVGRHGRKTQLSLRGSESKYWSISYPPTCHHTKAVNSHIIAFTARSMSTTNVQCIKFNICYLPRKLVQEVCILCSTDPSYHTHANQEAPLRTLARRRAWPSHTSFRRSCLSQYLHPADPPYSSSSSPSSSLSSF